MNNNKDIKFFSHDLIDIPLEAFQYISSAKKHHLVLKVAILSLKGYLPFIAFLDP